MSRRLLRLCCLCLLVLALPLQGLAAVAWLHGSPGHGPVAQATLPDADDAMPPCHGHAPAADQAMASTADTTTTPADASPAPHAGCSACASCCGHGSAPPALWPVALQPAPAAEALPAVTVPRIAPWTAEGIERPPRG